MEGARVISGKVRCQIAKMGPERRLLEPAMVPEKAGAGGINWKAQPEVNMVLQSSPSNLNSFF